MTLTERGLKIAVSPDGNEALLSYGWTRMEETGEDFIHLGKAFLTLLATIQGNHLDYIQAKLSPHKLVFEHPSREDSNEAIETALSDAQRIQFYPRILDSHLIAARIADASQHSSVYNEISRASFVDGKAPRWSNSVEHISRYITPEESTATEGLENPLDATETLHFETAEDRGPEPILNDVPSLHLATQSRMPSVPPSVLSSDWSTSPVQETEFTLPDDAIVTHWLYSYDQLSRLYRSSYEEIQYVVEIGDSFLREDAKDFINSFCRSWDAEDPWSRLPTGNPVTGMSLTEKIFKSLQCAETISADSLVEPIKLRMARVLLYHQYEQKLIELRHNSSSPTRLSSGKGLASIAKSVILERIYGSQYKNLTAHAKRKRENSLKWHTRIGKRWSYVTSQLGVGIILTCSHILEIHM
ncbi:uncharacterized protein SETTUDRAFT_36328 [Exserohilum turcica Et28A]|uniref:Uncharacterized protein n=1 Tax=Exserohilum turcicum (strain 28A) TaxID=671987 RepID=R0J235_EXST2|nr:uncharacterized protein SETTUDRAFT_36328 [Exserohilum turcica Et28A]EOA90826.1 hypothetical protein SETTUDRAFT_36328 [Exserohilum turcica Et28A]